MYVVERCNALFGTEYPTSKENSQVNITRTHELPEPEKDIGDTALVSPPQLPHSLQSSEQVVLHDMKRVIGDGPVSEFKLQFAPRWIIDKAIADEKSNYHDAGAYKELHFREIPKGANVITSHHFFQIKNHAEEGRLRLKCRLVPHGNRDREKESVRKDSATAQFPIIRLLLSLATILSLSVASIDIKGAYLQAGSLPRDIYVRPPPGWASSPQMLWKLLKPAYGIVESGRLWQLVSEDWLSGEGFLPISGLLQLFVRYSNRGTIEVLVAKVVDDFLIAGCARHIRQFHDSISQRFVVGSFVMNKDLVFNRLHIHKCGDGSLVLGMQEYVDSINPLSVTKERRRQSSHRATLEELTAYQGLSGSLNFLGHGILPQAAFTASYLQQAVGRLKVSNLVVANQLLSELKTLAPTLTFKSPKSLEQPCYLAFSDASQGTSSYGQTGYISGIFLPAGGASVFHTLDWLSCKQKRVAFSSTGAEILAAASSADRGSLMAQSISILTGATKCLPFVLTVDSRGLYSTITTLHEGADYRLRSTVARLRDSFENEKIAVMQWIGGQQNPADALTKRNVVMFRLLNTLMKGGAVPEELLRNARRMSKDNPST